MISREYLHLATCWTGLRTVARYLQYKNAIMKGKFEEAVFPIDYLLKDLDLALSTGTKLRIPLHFAALSAQQ
jgi:3-hydroxyisobutyrate dehydrogenase-like beta-hydroxyacid dehydrogenase